jgi:hypothetical protein
MPGRSGNKAHGDLRAGDGNCGYCGDPVKGTDYIVIQQWQFYRPAEDDEDGEEVFRGKPPDPNLVDEVLHRYCVANFTEGQFLALHRREV